jgi:hypothetical protein
LEAGFAFGADEAVLSQSAGACRLAGARCASETGSTVVIDGTRAADPFACRTNDAVLGARYETNRLIRVPDGTTGLVAPVVRWVLPIDAAPTLDPHVVREVKARTLSAVGSRLAVFVARDGEEPPVFAVPHEAAGAVVVRHGEVSHQRARGEGVLGEIWDAAQGNQ